MSLENYNFLALKTAVEHALAGAPSVKSPSGQIVNRAVGFLAKMRPWKWRQKLLSLDFTAVAITSLSRDANGIVTATVPSHALYAGQTIRVIGSTLATGTVGFDGMFTVGSASDANTLQWSQATAGSGLVGTATGGNLFRSYIALPADFGAFHTLRASAGSFRDVEPCSLEEIIDLRQWTNSAAFSLYYAISFLPQATVTAEPLGCIEIYPAPAAAFLGALQGVYLRRVPLLVGDTDLPDIPGDYHGLLLVLCRAMAVSTEDNQVGADWQLFNQMLPVYASEDGAAQGTVIGRLRSQLRGGGVPRSQFFPNGRIGHS